MLVALRSGFPPFIWTGTDWISDPDAITTKKAKFYEETEMNFVDLPSDPDIYFLQVPRREKWNMLGIVSPAEALALIEFRKQKRLGDE